MSENKKWTFGELRELFNKNAAEIEKVVSPLYEQNSGIQGVVLDVDRKTNEPVLVLRFLEGSKPDLKSVPEKIGELKVKTEFRGPARLL